MEYVPFKMEENHVTGPIESQSAGSELLYGITQFCGVSVDGFLLQSYSE